MRRTNQGAHLQSSAVPAVYWPYFRLLRTAPFLCHLREANSAHARQCGPGERANAQFKSWKILRKIRCYPHRAASLVKAVLVLILAG